MCKTGKKYIFKVMANDTSAWHNITPLSNQVNVITDHKRCISLQLTFVVVVKNRSKRRTAQEAVVGLLRKYVF